MNFSDRRVLVAGGTGLVGIQLVSLLIEKGARVRVASLDDHERVNKGTEFIKTDLRNYENCLAVCRGMDYVFNLLANKASSVAAAKYSATFFENNLLLDIEMLSAAKDTGVGGYLLASSVGVYPPGKEVFAEDDFGTGFPSPNDSGGFAKFVAEKQAEYYMRQFNRDIKISIVRPSNIYGPFDDFASVGAGPVPFLIRQAIEEEVVRIPAKGLKIRDYLFSRDAAEGMLFVAESGITEAVNLGSGIGVTIEQLANVIVSNLERKVRIIKDASLPSGDRRRVLDVKKLSSFGFKPSVSLEEGIRQTISWYIRHKSDSSGRYDAFSGLD